MDPFIEAELRRQCKDPELLAFFLRPWTAEDQERHEAGKVETARILAEHEAFMRARMADPAITWQDECTPVNPRWSNESIAAWKRKTHGGAG